MTNENDQAHADMIEQGIIWLACADNAYLHTNDEVYFSGYRQSMDAIAAEMKRQNVFADELDQLHLLPKHTRMLLGAEHKDACFSFMTVDKLGFMERSKLLLPLPSHTTVCRTRSLHYMSSGAVIPDKFVLFFFQNNQWHPVNPLHHKKTGRTKLHTNWRTGEWKQYDEYSTDLAPIPELAAVHEWSRRCTWSICFRQSTSPGLVAMTDPIGVKALLRLRDVPEGRTRREALRHWVKEHWRKNRNDPSVEDAVRQHLRGSTQCDWFGLNCRIDPSKVDLAKAATAERPEPTHRKRRK